MNRCWICGNPATTGEHKVKRSDLERIHGSGSEFKSADLAYRKSDQSIVQLQGPNSKLVKYKHVLCGACNNARTQPFDKSYDRFVRFIESQTTALLSRRQLDFASIYGSSWRKQQAYLFKYFVKAFGCRIADAGQPVPNDLRKIFADQYPAQSFAICLAVDEDEVEKPAESRNRLGIGHLVHSTSEGAEIRFAASSRYRWLLVSYWYNWGPYGPVGEPWHTNQQFLCLGSYRKDDGQVKVQREDGSLFDWQGIES